MKKSLAFVTIVSAALAVAGCNNKNKPKSGTTTEIAPASQPPVAYVPSQQATPDTTATPGAQATEVNPAPAENGGTASSAARSTGATHAHHRTAARETSEVASSSHAKITGKKYTVKKGDTLSEIVKAKYGTVKKMKAVIKANPGLDPDHIKVGQVIVLP